MSKIADNVIGISYGTICFQELDYGSVPCQLANTGRRFS